MPPPFYPLSQADLLVFFLHVADAVGVPVMLHNFPELVGKRIELETVAAFADRVPMAAIEQGGGEFEYHRELIALGREKNFTVMSGADTRLPEVFKLGADGCIGGMVNFVPEFMITLNRICREGRRGDAASVAAQMTEVGRVIDQWEFPLNVATGLGARGLRAGTPKSIASAESQRVYARLVGELRALFASWRLAPPPAAAN